MSIYDVIGMPHPLSGVLNEDPLSSILPFDLPQRRQTIADMLPQYTPEMEESALSQAAGLAGSGLSTLGNILDTPGAFARAILAGQNPFPGVLDTEQRISGRDLLEQWGALAPNQEGLDWGDVAGFGAEVAFDPLTYLTFGASALTQGGKAAAKAGTLADAVYGASGQLVKGARQAGMEAGQRGLIGIGLPFREPFAAIGSGPMAQKVASYLDKGSDFLRFGNPVGLAYGQLFDYSSQGASSRAGQILGREVTKALRRGETEALQDTFGVVQPILSGDYLGTDPQIVDALRRRVELGEALPVHLANAEPSAAKAIKENEDLLRELNEAGIPVDEYQSRYGGYFPRQKAQFDVDKTIGGKSQFIPTSTVFQQGREGILSDIPGETSTLDKMSIDPEISGPYAKLTPEAAAKKIRKEYFQFSDKDFRDLQKKVQEDAVNLKVGNLKGEKVLEKLSAKIASLKQAQNPNKQLIADLTLHMENVRTLGQMTADFEKSFGLSDYMRTLDPQHVEKKIGLFGTNPFENMATYKRSAKRAIEGANVAYDFLAQNINKFQAPLGGEDIVKTLSDMGLSRSTSNGTQVTDGALKQMADRLGIKPDELMKGKYKVPEDIAKQVKLVMKNLQAPEQMKGAVQLYDSFTNLFKGLNTLRPAFFSRNMTSGVIDNILTGMFDPTFKESHQVDQLLRNGNTVFEGASKIFGGKITDEEATQKIIEEVFSHRVYTGGSGQVNELANRSLLSGIPGQEKFSFKETVKGANPVSKEFWKFWNIQGVKPSLNKTVNPGAKAGENLNSYIEGMLRIPAYLNLRKQGFSAEVAAAKVKGVHVQYDELSQFEKQVMRRLVPFYSWIRKKSPEIARELLEKPGGARAQTIRAANLSREDSYMPPHVSQGAAIPLPSGPSGDSRYLTGFDISHEPVAGLFRPGATFLETIENTGSGLLGMANPAIKAPLEMIFGKQLFSGRDLTELDSRIGRMAQAVAGTEQPPEIPIPIDQALANSPFSGYASIVGTLLDPRKERWVKGVNLLTGAKITDVDTELSRDRAAQDLLARVLEENPNVRQFTQMYVPKEEIPNLSEEEKQSLALYRLVAERFRERAKERRGAGSL